MNWPTVKLGDVCEIERNGIDSSQIKSGTSYVGLENIEKGGNFNNVQPVNNGDLASTKFIFGPSHILYGKLRPYLAKIARPNFEGVCSTDILPLLPKASLNRDYLLYFLRMPKIVELANSRSTGANLPRLSPKALAEFEIPLPPLAEQQRIAARLDAADSLRALRRDAVAALDALTHSLFLEMFGDPAHNPMNWPMVKLGEVVTKMTNGANVEQKIEPKGWPVTRIETIWNAKIDSTRVRYTQPNEALREKYALQHGDILFSHINSPQHIAKTGLYKGKPEILIHGINLLLLRPDQSKVHPLWLEGLLKNENVRADFRSSCKKAVNQASLNQQDLKGYEIPLPPLSLQREFAARLGQIETVRSRMEDSRVRLDALFASLQSAAFEAG